MLTLNCNTDTKHNNRLKAYTTFDAKLDQAALIVCLLLYEAALSVLKQNNACLNFFSGIKNALILHLCIE